MYKTGFEDGKRSA